MTGANWKNVNNWHWVEKNCFPWAKEYLERELSGLEHVDASTRGKVRVEKLTSLVGDVDISQRKGKLIYIFDVTAKLEWTGERISDDGSVITNHGIITVNEATHDDEPEQYDIQYSNTEGSVDKTMLELLKKGLRPLLDAVFRRFPQDLLQAHGSTITVETNKPKAQVKPSTDVVAVKAAFKEQEAAAASLGTNQLPARSVTTVEVESELKASAEDVYQCLTDPGRLALWTGGSAKYGPTGTGVGSTLELLGGNISTKMITMEQGKLLVQHWRLKDWPPGHISTVHMTFNQGSNSTTVNVRQTDVPKEFADRMKTMWEQNYFGRIKQTFGFII